MSDAAPTKLYTALLAAMQDFGAVKKDRQNPAFRSSYATLHSILEAVEGPLHDNGIILVQRFGYDTEQPVLFTEVIHAPSGEHITSMIPIVCQEPNNPQKVGSAITYYRRYSLLTLLNLTPEDDDDGHAASQPPPRQRPQQRDPDDDLPAYVPARATSAPRSDATAPARMPTPPAAQRAPQRALAPNEVKIPCERCSHAGTCRTEGYCQWAAADLSNARPPTPPAAPSAPADLWTAIWTEARAQGINGRDQLAGFLGTTPDALPAPATILARLRDQPAPAEVR